MRVFDILLLGFLCAMMAVTLYILYAFIPSQPLEYESFAANISMNLPSQSYQFYPRMRYPDKEITYLVADACSITKRKNIEDALTILESRATLVFTELDANSLTSLPQITYECQNNITRPQNQSHFIAGEGGPTEIINTTTYAVILAGKVSLYRVERCESPIVALHETLHALGFDHTNDKKSIMYPVTDCGQELDQFIVDQLNELYAVPSAPDLAIESISATASGRYLSFDINVSNYGLKNIQNVDLDVTSAGKTVRTFSFDDIKIGQKKTLSVKNVRLPVDTEVLTFIVHSTPPQPEITLENNQASVHVKSS